MAKRGVKKDVLVEAPPITPQGSVLLTDAEVRQFQTDFENIKDIASNMATILIAVLLKEGENVDGQYMVPSDFLEKAKDGKIQMREDADGNVFVSIKTRAPQLIVMDGRL